MADTAIGFEAPELDLSAGADGASDVDAGADGADGADGSTADGSEGDGAAGAEGDGADAGKLFRAVENGKLSAAAKATLEKMKLENPQLAKAVQRALFAEDRLRREIPGGFKEVAQLREKIEALGGEEGIQSLQGELDGWKDFDAKYTAGDPKVLEFLTDTPEAQAAFLQIAPAAFEKFREVNQEGFDAYVSQVFAGDLNAQEIPMEVRLLGNLLGRATFSEPDKAEAVRIHTALVNYINRISGLAKKPVVAPATAKPNGGAEDTRTADLDTRERKLRSQEWESETGQQHGRIFTDAWKRLAANVPADKAALVRTLYGIHLKEKLKAKKDFDPNMDRYFKAKQKDGFMRLHESTFKEAVPLALRSAMAEAGIGARKAPAAAAKPGDGARPAAPARPATGFTPIAAKPSMGDVNNVLTSPTMWQNKQAILRNGKRVTWQ